MWHGIVTARDQIGEERRGGREQADHERDACPRSPSRWRRRSAATRSAIDPRIEERLADHEARFIEREKTRSTSRRVKSLTLTRGWCERNSRSLRFLRVLRIGFATVTSM